MSKLNGTTSKISDNNDLEVKQKPFLTSIAQAPVTESRKPFIPAENDVLMHAGTARATIAASREHPNGTTEDKYAAERQDRTVLQQHCEYWDTDRDGVIWPQDTYSGCRKFGWNPFLSALATFIINFNLSYPTCPSLVPDPFFRIWLDNIHKDKHGSDSMTFDSEGRFKPQQFEDIFAKYDRDNKGGLTIGDVWHFWNGQKLVFDFFGWSATMLEWLAVYLLLWPRDGVMRKEDVRGVYDGSIFYRKADEYAQSKGVKKPVYIQGSSERLAKDSTSRLRA